MFRKRLFTSLRWSVAAAVWGAGVALAQVPGAPALQNAFGNPGLAVAGNFGGGGGASFYGAAAAYGLGSGRLQVSAAAGMQRANSASRGAYGGRVSAGLWSSGGGALGAAAFAGIGGAPRTRDESDIVTNPAVLTVPVGVTIGYRRGLGATRGISAYASPLYRWTRLATDTETSSGTFAAAIGLDVSISQSFGATVGAEFGRSDGATSSTIGVALSFVPGR
ncbi:MAG: hypothetical protein WD801_02805 [Gemmatimonadaceae bacterium]